MDLSADHLFHYVPAIDDKSISIEDISELLFAGDYSRLIPKLYFLIKEANNKTTQLKLWEIRLLLLLFNDQLPAAKKEGISLNNALYLSDTQHSPPPPNSGLTYQGLTIYPLPKNNASVIPHSLLLLMLRLKSSPNLSLIHELYKLAYQLRLKVPQSAVLRTRLKILNYQVISVLTINKNYPTIINHLESIRNHLIESKDDDQFLSNITLLLLIIELLASVERGTTDEITAKYNSIFDSIDLQSRNSLVYVLRTIDPIIGREDKMRERNTTAELASFSELRSIIESNGITGRIVCALLGLWELSNNYEFEVKQNGTQLSFVPSHETSAEQDPIACIYNSTTRNWYKYIHKVYCLE